MQHLFGYQKTPNETDRNKVGGNKFATSNLLLRDI